VSILSFAQVGGTALFLQVDRALLGTVGVPGVVMGASLIGLFNLAHGS